MIENHMLVSGEPVLKAYLPTSLVCGLLLDCLHSLKRDNVSTYLTSPWGEIREKMCAKYHLYSQHSEHVSYYLLFINIFIFNISLYFSFSVNLFLHR